MGNFLSSSSANQTANNEQVAVQGGSGPSIATGAKGVTTGGASIAVGQGGSFSAKNSNISITSSDPATVAAALESVNNAVNASAAVSATSITQANADTTEALSALEEDEQTSAQLSNNAVLAGATVANNAQSLAYGGPDQAITGQAVGDTSSSTTSLGTWLGIGAAVLAIWVFVKTGGKTT